jgi:YVTN family beta-propeller protein
MVYVSNLLNNTVSVVSASKMVVLSTLKVGDQPGDMAFDPVLGDVFVVNQGNDTVSVVGGQTNSLIDTVRVGANYCLSCGVGPAGGLGVDTDNGDVYVAVPGAGNVTVISKCTTLACAEISGASPPCGSYGVVWIYPNSSPALPGSQVSSTVTTCTKGRGSWSITNQASNVTVASGSFSCPCADVTLFNYTAGVAPITNGTYWFQEGFNGGEFGATFVVGGTQ